MHTIGAPHITTCCALVAVAIATSAAGSSIGTQNDPVNESGRLPINIRNRNPEHRNRRDRRASLGFKGADSVELNLGLLGLSGDGGDFTGKAQTASPAPSNPPSASPMPTTAAGHNTTVSPAPSNPPSISPPPSVAGGVPSAPPSISYPPTTTNHTQPPSVSPMPSSPPTPDNNNHEKGGLTIFQKLLRAVGWTIAALATALAFGWIVSNHRRILPLLGELWLRIRTTDWRRFVMNLAATMRESCSGLYHRLRFGRWSFRGLGGRDYDTVPLNEIVFDPHDSGDPTELLLQRER